jgi:hypothetical protein
MDSVFLQTMMRMRRPETQWDTTPIQDPMNAKPDQMGATPPSQPPMGLSSAGPSPAALQAAVPKPPPPELDASATFGLDNPSTKPRIDTQQFGDILNKANTSRKNFVGGLRSGV